MSYTLTLQCIVGDNLNERGRLYVRLVEQKRGENQGRGSMVFGIDPLSICKSTKAIKSIINNDDEQRQRKIIRAGDTLELINGHVVHTYEDVFALLVPPMPHRNSTTLSFPVHLQIRRKGTRSKFPQLRYHGDETLPDSNDRKQVTVVDPTDGQRIQSPKMGNNCNHPDFMGHGLNNWCFVLVGQKQQPYCPICAASIERVEEATQLAQLFATPRFADVRLQMVQFDFGQNGLTTITPIHHTPSSTSGFQSHMMIHGKSINADKLIQKMTFTQLVVDDSMIDAFHDLVMSCLNIQFSNTQDDQYGLRWEDITDGSNDLVYMTNLANICQNNTLYQDTDIRYQRNLLMHPVNAPFPNLVGVPVAYQIYLWAHDHLVHNRVAIDSLSWRIASNLTLLYRISQINFPNPSRAAPTTNSNKKKRDAPIIGN
jgi:hypothetical protein